MVAVGWPGWMVQVDKGEPTWTVSISVPRIGSGLGGALRLPLLKVVGLEPQDPFPWVVLCSILGNEIPKLFLALLMTPLPPGSSRETVRF